MRLIQWTKDCSRVSHITAIKNIKKMIPPGCSVHFPCEHKHTFKLFLIQTRLLLFNSESSISSCPKRKPEIKTKRPGLCLTLTETQMTVFERVHFISCSKLWYDNNLIRYYHCTVTASDWVLVQVKGVWEQNPQPNNWTSVHILVTSYCSEDYTKKIQLAEQATYTGNISDYCMVKP